MNRTRIIFFSIIGLSFLYELTLVDIDWASAGWAGAGSDPELSMTGLPSGR